MSTHRPTRSRHAALTSYHSPFLGNTRQLTFPILHDRPNSHACFYRSCNSLTSSDTRNSTFIKWFHPYVHAIPDLGGLLACFCRRSPLGTHPAVMAHRCATCYTTLVLQLLPLVRTESSGELRDRTLRGECSDSFSCHSEETTLMTHHRSWCDRN